MAWAKIKHFLRPTKITIIILLALVSAYLFVTLLHTFTLYSMIVDISYAEVLVFQFFLSDVCEETVDCDADILKTRYDDTLYNTRKDIPQTKMNLNTLQLMKTAIFPAEQHLEIFSVKGTYELEGFRYIVGLLITPTLVIQVLIMILYWYAIASGANALVNLFRKAPESP